MIKISKLADYAVVVLATLSRQPEASLSAAAVAEISRLPEPTVAKVLKLLANGGVVTSTRGAGGGYALARGAAEISIADILVAVDGPIAMTSCVEGQHEGACGYAANCPVHGRWDGVNDAIKGALSEISLAQMIKKEKLDPALRPDDGSVEAA